MQQRDTESRTDCEQLVRGFYAHALTDPVIGRIFTDVAKLDLEAHVPHLTAFWETLLLGAQTYDRGAFPPPPVDGLVRCEASRLRRLLALPMYSARPSRSRKK